ncbi:ubiquitin-binding protein cue5 [Paecilomyces lecythidis]|uniref:Ubiquitin-binding protein cue5 n=1 Tax=Paecilomyces lecythidis TaxID=3004212 RepID=A0ABR3YG37_9EURO
MADEDKTATPTKAAAALSSPKPESPTTARPLDFDGDDEPQESGVTSSSVAPGQSTESAPAPPPKPPRPLTPQQQAENTLKEAFPTVEASVVKAVLVASGGNLERAFHALLGMTDPNAQQEDLPPPRPPRPSNTATSTAQSQLEADERYARQLAEHYSGAVRRGPSSGLDGNRGPRSRRESEEEREYSFFDDDLPVIRENIRKGFLETQSKVNSWVQNFKKKIDGEEDEDQPAGEYHRDSGSYGRPRRSGDMGRRSADRERYDADPQVISDDFATLELRDSEVPPPRPARPLANPNLFKTSSPSPDRRKVSFQEGPPEEIDNLYDAPESAQRAPSTGGKPSKWQPLAAVDPSPVGEHDPFSLGDSDDEKETKNKESNADEGDRAKQATTEAIAGEVGSSSKDDNKPKETGH